MFKGFQKLIVLKELSKQELSGYILMKRIEEISGKKPSSGYIYPLLKELSLEEYISKRKDDNRIIYTINHKGVLLLKNLDDSKKQLDNILLKLNQSKKSGINAIQSFNKEKLDPTTILRDIDIILKLQKAILSVYKTKSHTKRQLMRKRILKEIRCIERLANS
jgi:DNA-binding PadR family transcriptional regulator